MKAITHKTYRKKEVLSCYVCNPQVVPVFIDMVSVLTIKCENTKGFDTKTNDLKFTRAPMFSRTPFIKIEVKKTPMNFRVRDFKLFLYALRKAIEVTLVAIKLAFFCF